MVIKTCQAKKFIFWLNLKTKTNPLVYIQLLHIHQDRYLPKENETTKNFTGILGFCKAISQLTKLVSLGLLWFL